MTVPIFGAILILLLILLARFTLKGLPFIDSAKLKGLVGERYVSNILSQLPEEYIVYNDLVFHTNSGTTQIDHLVFSKYGIFAVETKNYTGKIYGDDSRLNWTQIIVTDVTYRRRWWQVYTHVTKNHFYNPVKQACGHVYRIKELLKDHPHLPIVPIIVFVGDADLSEVKTRNHVVIGQELIPLIISHKNICITNEEFIAIYNILNSYNIRQEVDDETHVNNVKRVEQSYQSAIQSGICPKCGGRLVQKNGKYGLFYGCSNYPKCKFTTK